MTNHLTKGSSWTLWPSSDHHDTGSGYHCVDVHPPHTEKEGEIESSVRRGLYWSNLHYSVPCPSQGLRRHLSADYKTLLDGVSGHVAPGEMVAIMGSSGAGKSTLLNSLAGRVKTGKLSGTILFNNQKRVPHLFKKQASYVEQDDLLYPQLTVRETLHYAATLKLPCRSHATQAIRQRVEEVITALRLGNAADTYIGDTLVRGVSGGERKRTSIGIELVTDPQFLFLDEATSGLDSNSALHVCEVVRQIGQQRQVGVLMTIHQPSSTILNLFDKIILLSRGQTVYYGGTQQALGYFASLGYHCGEHENPADFYLDLMTIDHTSPERLQESEARVNHLVESFRNFVQRHPEVYNPTAQTLTNPSTAVGSLDDNRDIANYPDGEIDTDMPSSAVSDPKDGKLKLQNAPSCTTRPTGATGWALSWGKELYVLTQRCWTVTMRSRFSLVTETFRAIVVTLMLGFIFFEMGHDQPSVRGRIGLLFFFPVDILFAVVMPSLVVVALEMAIMSRERRGGTYRISTFYLAKFLTALPIPLVLNTIYCVGVYFLGNLHYRADKFFIFLGMIWLLILAMVSFGMAIGAIFHKIQVAQVIAPLLLIIGTWFGGNVISSSQITPVLSWIRYLAPIYYVYHALAQNEFNGLTFTCGGAVNNVCLSSGTEVLREYDLDDLNIGICVACLLGLMVAYHVVIYLALRLKDKTCYIWI
ncbi:hypothetical protein IWQ61_009161 [Dispira simplex]|nr:hypothetical protein IWQ61_009161 [Dispira simplex]